MFGDLGWLVAVVPVILALIIWFTANASHPSKVLLIVAAVLVLLGVITIWWGALSNGWNPLDVWQLPKRLGLT